MSSATVHLHAYDFQTGGMTLRVIEAEDNGFPSGDRMYLIDDGEMRRVDAGTSGIVLLRDVDKVRAAAGSFRHLLMRIGTTFTP